MQHPNISFHEIEFEVQDIYSFAHANGPQISLPASLLIFAYALIGVTYISLLSLSLNQNSIVLDV